MGVLDGEGEGICQYKRACVLNSINSKTAVPTELRLLATHCLFNTLFILATRNTKGLHYWPFVRGIHWWPVESPHKGPVIWKALPCPNIIPVKASGPLWGESTSDQWIPLTKGQYCGNTSMSWHHPGEGICQYKRAAACVLGSNLQHHSVSHNRSIHIDGSLIMVEGLKKIKCTLKTKNRHDAKIVVPGITRGCCNDNLWCHQ